MKVIIRFFSSIILTVVLLVIIAVFATMGTFIPQQKEAEFYASKYGSISPILLKLNMNDIYHSSIFLFILLVFSFNLILCTSRRLPLKWQKIRRYWSQAKTSGNHIFFTNRKRIIGFLGPEIVHMGILFILSGALINGIGGSRQYLSLKKGETFTIKEANFQFRLDDLNIETYADESIKDWKSTLSIFEDDQKVHTQTIEVNHPFSYKGYAFYQQGWGWDWTNPLFEVQVQKKSDSGYLDVLHLKAGEKANLSHENMKIWVVHYIPDFFISEDNKIISRSSDPNNPAVFIVGLLGKKRVFSGWLFARHPEFSRIQPENATDFHFILKDLKARPYSVIQISHDPGIIFIWTGCAVLFLGLILAFYWRPLEISKTLLESDDTKENISGIPASKGSENRQKKLNSIQTTVRRSP